MHQDDALNDGLTHAPERASARIGGVLPRVLNKNACHRDACLVLKAYKEIEAVMPATTVDVKRSW